MQTSPFDSEFNSASNDDTFIYRTYFAKNLCLYNPILLISRRKNLYKIFLKHVRWIKVSLFDAELNSGSNALV